jgi:hypothetical protein
MWIVFGRMKCGAVVRRLAMVVLIAITIFVSAVRPIAHRSDRLFPQLHGLTRMSLLSESPDTDSTSLPTPVADAHPIAPALVVGLLLFVLKTRRTAFRPLPLRRLKIPARRADGSPASH